MDVLCYVGIDRVQSRVHTPAREISFKRAESKKRKREKSFLRILRESFDVGRIYCYTTDGLYLLFEPT